MGYRYVVRGVRAAAQVEGSKLKMGSDGDVVTLDLEIENTGFGPLLFAEEPEVLLAPNGSEVAEAVRVPAEMSATLASLRGGTTGHISLAFPCKVGAGQGELGVWLRVRAPLDDEAPDATPRRVIRFANAECWNPDLKANYLCTILFSPTP